MEEFKGTKKVYAVEYAGTIFINEGPHYEDENVLDMLRVGDETAWANAKLYEAAPDLLEALQELMKVYKEIVDSVYCGWWIAEEQDEFIKAQKAINKALGK